MGRGRRGGGSGLRRCDGRVQASQLSAKQHSAPWAAESERIAPGGCGGLERKQWADVELLELDGALALRDGLHGRGLVSGGHSAEAARQAHTCSSASTEFSKRRIPPMDSDSTFLALRLIASMYCKASILDLRNWSSTKKCVRLACRIGLDGSGRNGAGRRAPRILSEVVQRRVHWPLISAELRVAGISLSDSIWQVANVTLVVSAVSLTKNLHLPAQF